MPGTRVGRLLWPSTDSHPPARIFVAGTPPLDSHLTLRPLALHADAKHLLTACDDAATNMYDVAQASLVASFSGRRSQGSVRGACVGLKGPAGRGVGIVRSRRERMGRHDPRRGLMGFCSSVPSPRANCLLRPPPPSTHRRDADRP